MSSSLRLSERSATSPAHGPSTSSGANWVAASRPRATPLPVRRSTSRVWATIVSQLPTCEISCPPKKSRKLRVWSETEGLARDPADAGSARAARRWRGGGRGHRSRPLRPGPRARRGRRRGAPARRGQLGDPAGRARRPCARGPARRRSRPCVGGDARAPPGRSSGSGSRATLPSASSRATTPVMVGGATPSWAASSPRVMEPWRSMATRADSWLGDRPGVGVLAQRAVETGDGEAHRGGDLGDVVGPVPSVPSRPAVRTVARAVGGRARGSLAMLIASRMSC